MDPEKAMEMAKSMGANPEALKKDGSCHEIQQG